MIRTSRATKAHHLAIQVDQRSNGRRTFRSKASARRGGNRTRLLSLMSGAAGRSGGESIAAINSRSLTGRWTFGDLAPELRLSREDSFLWIFRRPPSGWRLPSGLHLRNNPPLMADRSKHTWYVSFELPSEPLSLGRRPYLRNTR